MTAPKPFENVGVMGTYFAAKKWEETSLGAPETWSPLLRGYVDMILRMPDPAIIFWGPDQLQLYNLGYSQIMGPRHPRYLGEPYRDCWPDTYPNLYPWMREVLDHGIVKEVEDTLIPLTRYGFVEETYFTFSFVPLRDENGEIAGFIQPIKEVTATHLAERRLATTRSLSPRIASASDAVTEAIRAFQANPEDVPFSLLYVVNDDSSELVFAGATGIEGDVPGFHALAETVIARNEIRLLEDLTQFIGDAQLGPWPEPARTAMVLPLQRAEDAGIRGAVVLGISSRLHFDSQYRAFFEACARELASNLTFEAENRRRDQMTEELKRRAEALQELDRAKTVFFSNVSHEFRTPLTLMLGPLEDVLVEVDAPLTPAQREQLELVRRNGLRLFKLVNALLEFSRSEARRARTWFEPTDLATVTLDLASSFRSLVEKAGLRLVVECPDLGESVWVDHEMWEKIVLNLLSNAFKFTLRGEIGVSLACVHDRVELRVRDTGVGIPPEELGKVFDRFHRVEGAHGRSFEGSGIGLALVRELVLAHGGTVRVESAVGVGSTFIVDIPRGHAHLPRDQVKHAPQRAHGSTRTAFVREAMNWLRDQDVTAGTAAPHGGPARPRVLLADDNADMRDYVERLLSPAYIVQTVTNGREALDAIALIPPDLVLSDVMMPELDGFGLLAAIKANPATSKIPVILLSARAGEESRVDGMTAGADDYLVKPFSARELIARVSARLEIARAQVQLKEELERRVAERTAQLQEANRELEAFSYSVSHDLRAPLRHIVGFSQMLERRAGPILDEKSAGYLRTISDAAKRGGQLVDDLLAFSRMGRSEMQVTRVSLGALVEDVRRELAPDQEGRVIEWTVRPLPEVHADPGLLRLVMRNLLANAIKYTRERAVARIEVTTLEYPREYEIVIKDNGVGFDMKYVDKLFGVFQRLHTQEQFDGNGIGLALVRRIIHRHRGRTWAEGEVGVGASLHVTLPRS